MSQDDKKVPEFKPDVPSTGLVVRTAQEAKTLALKISGRPVPNEARFHCTMCGWDKTVQFEPDEIEAMPDRDVRNWPQVGGRCMNPDCGEPTIVAHDFMADVDFMPAMEQARKQRKEDVQDATRTAIQTAKEELLGVITPGSIFDSSKDAPPRPAKKPGDLPDADDVDTSGLEPRKTEG